MPQTQQHCTLKSRDIPKAAKILKNAFKDDTLWKSVFKDIPNEEKKRKAFFEMPLRQGFSYGKVITTSENLEGIGVILPNTRVRATFWNIIRSGALKAVMTLGSDLGKKLGTVFTPMMIDQFMNMGKRSYYYISILGVDPTYQGKGYGGQILKALIEKSNEDKMPLYLETQSENNVAFYEKYGFKVLKKITLPLVDHPMWEMVREPDET